MTQQKHTLHLNNGAAYILEGCMQDPGPCTTPSKIVLWAKVWDKVRKAVNRTMSVDWSATPIDLETPIFINDGETELQFKKREVVFNQAFKAWRKVSCDLILNDKHRDAVREAVKYVIAHKDDERARTKVDASEFWALLMIELGLSEQDEDDASELTAGSSAA